VTIVLDAGALIAVERRDRGLMALLESEFRDGRTPVTHGAVVAQVWRGGTGRQALLARALAGINVVAVNAELGRRAGVLLGRAGVTDAVDAALVALANDGDEIYTSDADDLRTLVEAADVHVDIVPI
jgi:hypothetical protein